MKHFLFSMLAACTLMLSGCTKDLDELTTEPADDGQTLHTAILEFNGGIDRFEGLTRAVASDWADGARLYIQYTTTSGRVDGAAIYSQSTGQWEVQYYGTITKGQTAKCEVYFFDNPQTTALTSVTLSAQSAVFADNQASYLYEDGVVKLSAHLKPLTGRLRFRGTAGQQVTFSGLKWYSGYNISSNTLSTQASEMTLTVAQDGFTPYVYATFADANTPQLAVASDDDDYNFNKSFDNTVLAIGKSGYLDIPTMTSRNGWQLVKDDDPLGICRNSKHPHVVDMGDGLKWSCCNVGAKTPIEYGDYFAWGETTTKSTYDWSTYKYCKGSSTTMTKYCNSSSYGTVDNKTQLELSDDAARANWGGTWRMPTIDELSKLNSNCTWSWTTVNNVNGYMVTAKNGNKLFLPAAGYRSDSSLSNAGSYGDYWSSSLGTSYAKYARHLYFYSSNRNADGSNRCGGRSVRPVTE